MAGSSGSLHENEQSLNPEIIDRHRAIVSIMEELEAIDWYDQRVEPPATPSSRSSSRTTATRRRSMPPWCWSGCVAGIRS